MNRIATFIAAIMILGTAVTAQASVGMNYTYLSPSDSLAGVWMNSWVTELESRTDDLALSTVDADVTDAQTIFRTVVSGKAQIGCVSVSDIAGFDVRTCEPMSSVRLMQTMGDRLPKQFRRVKVVSMFVAEDGDVNAVIMNRRSFRILPFEAKAAIAELAFRPADELAALDADAIMRTVISGKADVARISLSEVTGEAVRYESSTPASSLRLMQQYVHTLPLQFRRVEVINMYVGEDNEVYATIMNRRAYRLLPDTTKAILEGVA